MIKKILKTTLKNLVLRYKIARIIILLQNNCILIVWGNKEQRSNITCAIWTFYSQRIWETNRTPLSQLNKSMPGSIDISIHLHANHLYACTFSISRKSDGLRRICSSVYEPFYCDSLAVVSFEWRKEGKRKKKKTKNVEERSEPVTTWIQ